MPTIVYCSGPLFSPEEQGGMAALARVLEEAGYDTFLPQRDGLEAYLMRFVDSPLNLNVLGMREKIDRAIFALDVYQLVERCAGFVFNMNGRVPDEGGVAEAAIAFSVGKPVVLYKNDHRSAFHGRDNSMLTGLSPIDAVSDLQQVPEALGKLLKGHAATPALTPDSRLASTVRMGGKIWKLLERLPSHFGKDRSGEELVAEIAALVSQAEEA